MRPPIACTIAGTDPSGGAGIHADLKTFSAHRVYGTSVITAVVAQNTHGVSSSHTLTREWVDEQFAAVFDDLPVDACKTGMLATRELVRLVVDRLGAQAHTRIVVDPVMVATSGHRLLAADAVAEYRETLLPLAGLITPNLPEAALLLGDDVEPASDRDTQVRQACALLEAGPRAVLLKGGHGTAAKVLDVLALRTDGGIEVREFEHARVHTEHTHGTGCTLAAALTAQFARVHHAGDDPLSAQVLPGLVEASLGYVHRAVESGARWQLMHDPAGAHGPLDHQVEI